MVVTGHGFDFRLRRFRVLAPLPGGLKAEGASESPFMAKEEASDTSAWHAQLLVQLSELLDLSLMEGTVYIAGFHLHKNVVVISIF